MSGSFTISNDKNDAKSDRGEAEISSLFPYRLKRDKEAVVTLKRAWKVKINKINAKNKKAKTKKRDFIGWQNWRSYSVYSFPRSLYICQSFIAHCSFCQEILLKKKKRNLLYFHTLSGSKLYTQETSYKLIVSDIKVRNEYQRFFKQKAIRLNKKDRIFQICFLSKTKLLYSYDKLFRLKCF